LGGTREQIQESATQAALVMLWKLLGGMRDLRAIDKKSEQKASRARPVSRVGGRAVENERSPSALRDVKLFK